MFSTSVGNETVNEYLIHGERSFNLRRCDLENHDYYKKRMVVGGGETENETDYDFARMINEDCGCSSTRIPGGIER
jgi:hypothetical protein